MDPTSPTLRNNPPPSHAQRFAAWAVRTFHAYANWLVGISWKRFIVLSILLMIIAGVLQNVPPFTWRISETVETLPPRPPKPPKPAVASDKPVNYDVTIDSSGIRIRPAGERAASSAASAAASAASAGAAAEAAGVAASAAASAASEALARHRNMPSISIDLPADVKSSDVRAAVEEARQAIEEAVADAREAAADAAHCLAVDDPEQHFDFTLQAGRFEAEVEFHAGPLEDVEIEAGELAGRRQPVGGVVVFQGSVAALTDFGDHGGAVGGSAGERGKAQHQQAGEQGKEQAHQGHGE